MSFSKDQVEAVVARADDQIDASLNRLLDFMRIPSVSTDSAYAQECRRAADFMVDELAEIGFDARTVDTIGHPMVVGHHPGASEDAPHILFYGHYDVQPVDPIELWNSDPFDPKIETREDGSKLIRGRGPAAAYPLSHVSLQIQGEWHPARLAPVRCCRGREARIHAHRTPGGDRHYRDPGRHASSRPGQSQAEGGRHPLHE